MISKTGIKDQITVTGIDELVAKLTKIGDPKKTRSTMLKILRKQARPIVMAARNEAPMSKKAHKRYGGKGSGTVLATYQPGNLKKSIVVGASKSINPSVWIGPGSGAKRRYDGYYGHIVHYTNPRSRAKTIVPGNPFMQRAWNSTGAVSTEKTRAAVAKVIQKEIDRYSK